MTRPEKEAKKTLGFALRPPDIFETSRLRLRPPRVDDAQALFDAYASDPEGSRFTTWQRHQDIGETEAFLEAAVDGWADGTDFTWVIESGEGGELFGAASLHPGEHGVSLGYVLGRRWWRKGLATEAATKLVEWALAQPEVFRVWAITDRDNVASARVLEKSGMQREGLLRRWIVHPNISPEPRDAWVYSRVR